MEFSLQDAAQPYDPQQDEALTQSIMRMFQVRQVC